MPVRLAGQAQPLELSFVWEPSSLPERVEIPDLGSARSFLARLSRDGHAPALRRLAGPSAGRPRDDAEVIAVLAGMIATGRLLVHRGPPFRLPAFDVEEEEEAPVARPVSARPPPVEEAEAPQDEALPPVTVDGALQAATLRRAAEKGIPFCEECERKARKKPPPEDDTSHLDQAAMARTLVRAAEEGAPVCEECERRKKALQDRPPPPVEDDEDDEDGEDEDEAPESDPGDETP